MVGRIVHGVPQFTLDELLVSMLTSNVSAKKNCFNPQTNSQTIYRIAEENIINMLQVNDLRSRIDANRELINTAIDRVITRGWLVLGSEVANFEQAFAEYVCSRHCVTVANGTDALEIGLRALGVQSNDKVATVANAGMYATTAILAIGAQPIFIDVDSTNHLTTLHEVKKAVEMGASSVVVTHLFGLAIPEIREISSFCTTAGIPLLEDCAQAHGSRINETHVGTFGDAGCFSFYPTKNLGALGDGGAVVTSKDEIAEKIRMVRQYGWSSKYCVALPGGRNSRLDEIQAAVLNEFLSRLDASNESRRLIANQYNKSIKNPKIMVPMNQGPDYVAHLYVVRCKQRDKLKAYLAGLGIGSDIHFPIPDHRQPLLAERYKDIHLTTTESLAQEILTLPCYPELEDRQIVQVIKALNEWRP